MQTPVGSPALPAEAAPASLEEWARIASGAFRNEADVEIHVVEPLLNLIAKANPAVTWKAKAPLGPLVPDFSLYRVDKLQAVVEVKLGVRTTMGGRSWAGSDLDQIRRYCTRGEVPGLLVDANRVLLVDANSEEPSAVFERSTITQRELGLILRHSAGLSEQRDAPERDAQ